MPRFNLVDEAWISCAERAGGLPRLYSLRAIFAEAPRLHGIADSSPSVTISLYRLLLALLHRSLGGPGSVAEWRSVHDRGAWDLERIDAYLTRWHGRFDLFDASHPFYQTPNLAVDPPSATQLAPERASVRNRYLLFDHTTEDRATLAPAEAARYLVAMHNFAVGGLIGLLSGEPIANKFTSAAPLLGAAVTLVRGTTLFDTLMLNWVRYHRADEVPFAFRGDDQPAWEREGGAQPEPRLPDGYVDLLTWQSRRILLIPEEVPDGGLRVRAAALMKGFQFAEGHEPHSTETMVGYSKNTHARTGPAWYPVRLDSDRVVWRDSQALIQSVADERRRPKVMDWLDTLIDQRAIPETWLVPLDVYGLIPDQANIRDWRRESLPLPLQLLQQRREVTRHLLDRLREAIVLAEGVAGLLEVGFVEIPGRERPAQSPTWTLCAGLLMGLSDRMPRRQECADLANAFGAPARFWSQLDGPFREFIVHLVDVDDVVEEGGATRYGMLALRAWVGDVKRAARDVWDSMLAGQDGSVRALRAGAQAQQRFNQLLYALVTPYEAPEEAPQGEGESA